MFLKKCKWHQKQCCTMESACLMYICLLSYVKALCVEKSILVVVRDSMQAWVIFQSRSGSSPCLQVSQETNGTYTDNSLKCIYLGGGGKVKRE